MRASPAYHHGNLREALLDAVDTIVQKKGVEAVSLRECARQIGVSHAAAFRHFPDKRALLTSFAARAAARMVARIDAEIATDPAGRNCFLMAGLGYVRFAMEEPGAFQAVFRDKIINADDPDYRGALAELDRRLASGAASGNVGSPIAPPALLAWAAVHGLATLLVEGSLAGDLPQDRIGALRETLALLSPIFEKTGPVVTAPEHPREAC